MVEVRLSKSSDHWWVVILRVNAGRPQEFRCPTEQVARAFAARLTEQRIAA